MLTFFKRPQKQGLPAIALLSAWQFVCLLLIAVAGWPLWLVWLNLALSASFVLLSNPADCVYYLILNIPLYSALPSGRFSAVPAWRILFLLLFARWFFSKWRQGGQSGEKIWQLRLLAWDKFLALFAAIAALSVLRASYPLQGAKEIIFWLNIYLFYVVLVNVIKTRREVVTAIGYTAASLALIVLLGYVQLIATFFTSLNIFWVYWASYISRLYYGPALTQVLLYSNSWFSYTGNAPELRMFSIMPDSHSFAMMAVFCIAFILPLTYYFGKKYGYYLWSAIRFAGLAIILSGTRAVWVGLATPLLLVSMAVYANFYRPIFKKLLITYLLIILFFVLAPFINQGLHYLRVSKFKENFLARVQTIYDLQEESNAGRLQIWRNSLNYALSHPLGTGLGNFIVSLREGGGKTAGDQPSYQDLAEAHNSRFNLPQKYVTAHNLYLQILVETSVFGLAAFVLFWWRFFSTMENFIKARGKDNSLLAFFVINIAIAFLWLLTAAVFDVTFFNDRVLIYFFISLGLVGVIINRYSQLHGDE